jgi:hypothetical protein
MNKLAHNLASLGKELYVNGFEKEAQTMLFTSLRIAHMDHPLHGVIEDMGFESCDDAEPGDGLEIFINIDTNGKAEYELVKGGDSHQFDSFEELVSHLTEDDESDCGCGCGGGCKEASSSIFRKADSLMDSLKKERNSDEYLRYIDEFGYMPYEDWLAEKDYANIDLSEKNQEECEHESTYEDWSTAGRSFGPMIVCSDCGKVLRAKDIDDYEREESERESYRTSAKKKKNQNKPLNKPFRTPGGPKKFSVYVKNEKGNVVKVNFGDPNMKIRRSEPGRRKNFRARHNCDNPGPKTKARYWSCKFWSKPSVSSLLKKKK